MRPLLLTLLFLAALPSGARAEASFSLFGGYSWSPDADVTVRQSGGTDLTMGGVGWKSKAVDSPLYGGGRILFWLPRLPVAGFGFDYTHAKALASDEQIVEVRGTRAGTDASGWEPVGRTVQGLGFSVNFLMLTMLKRWLKDQYQPYVGLGLGAAIPHVSGTIGPVRGDTTRYGGLAFEGFAGVTEVLFTPVSAFLEYKIQHAHLDVPYDAGTQVTTNLWVHQGVAGLTVSFGSAPQLTEPAP